MLQSLKNLLDIWRHQTQNYTEVQSHTSEERNLIPNAAKTTKSAQSLRGKGQLTPNYGPTSNTCIDDAENRCLQAVFTGVLQDNHGLKICDRLACYSVKERGVMWLSVE